MDEKGRSVAPQALVRCGYAKWSDVLCGDYLRRDVSEQLDPQWRDRYAALGATVYTVQAGLAELRQRAPCDMWSWALKRQSQRVLVAVSWADAPHMPGMNPQNWGFFGNLRIPGGDYDFVRKALRRKLALSKRLAQ